MAPDIPAGNNGYVHIILETPRLTLRQFTEHDVGPVRTTPYQGADVIEGAEHGEVEYALTKTE
jgi:hypothetical protein